jgi:hypothetical protein
MSRAGPRNGEHRARLMEARHNRNEAAETRRSSSVATTKLWKIRVGSCLEIHFFLRIAGQPPRLPLFFNRQAERLPCNNRERNVGAR